MGAINVKHTGSGAAIALSSDGTSLLLDGTAIGGGGSPDLFAESYDGTSGLPVATGSTNAVAVGRSYASGTDSFAAAIANNTATYGAQGANSIAMGKRAKAVDSTSVAVGQDSSAANGGYALGLEALASGTQSLALGGATDATAAYATALGKGAQATHQGATAIGYLAATTTTNQVAVGASGHTVRVSGVYNLPTADGTANQVLTTDGSGAVTFADAGGGGSALELYAENPVTPTAPSATGDNAVAIGDSALSTGLNSMAIGKARAAGNNSFAAAIATSSTSYGASGSNSIAIGSLSKATASDAVAIGDRAIASSAPSLALGARAEATAPNAIAIGLLSDATGAGSVAIGNGYSFIGPQATFYNAIAIGQGSLSDKIGKVAISGSAFAANGDGQHGIFVLRVATTNATAKPLITGTDYVGSATPDTENQVVLPNNSAYSFSGTIIARQQAADGSNYASWEIKGALIRDANAASTVLGNGIVNKLYATAGASAWAIALTADTTNGGLKIEATGAAATDIRWVATVNTSEVTYA